MENVKYRFIHRKYNGHFLAVNQETNILECLHDGCKVISSDCRLIPFDEHCVSSSSVLRIDSNLLIYHLSDNKLTLPHHLVDGCFSSEHIMDELIIIKKVRKET